MRKAGFPGAAVAVFPPDLTTHGADGFGTLAEGFEIDVERIVAVEVREGVDAVAQAEGRVGEDSPVGL